MMWLHSSKRVQHGKQRKQQGPPVLEDLCLCCPRPIPLVKTVKQIVTLAGDVARLARVPEGVWMVQPQNKRKRLPRSREPPDAACGLVEPDANVVSGQTRSGPDQESQCESHHRGSPASECSIVRGKDTVMSKTSTTTTAKRNSDDTCKHKYSKHKLVLSLSLAWHVHCHKRKRNHKHNNHHNRGDNRKYKHSRYHNR